MKQPFKGHNYWLIAGIIIFLLLIGIYPFSVFTSLRMEVTRNQAEEIALNFLENKDFSVRGFKREVFLDNSPIENRYILKKLGNKGFTEYNHEQKKSNFGWTVMLYQDLPRQIAQTTYYVDITSKGQVYGFRREIPDTAYSPKITKEQATELALTVAKNHLGRDFNGFALVESKEANYSKRSDYSFRWEKSETKLEGKLVILAVVQGDRVGRFSYYFEVPQADREYFGTTETLYGTLSAIFIMILIIISFYLFIKKYHQGEIWITLGRNLFIFFFGISLIEITNLWPGLGLGTNLGELSFTNVKIIILVINGLFIYFFLSLLVFASWTVGESYARSLWPNKLRGIDALIKGHLFSISSGTSLIRGLVLGSGLALSVLIGSIIFNTPNAFIFISPTCCHEIFIGWLPAISSLFSGIGAAILTSIVMTFLIVNISYNRWKKKWLSIVLTGLVMMLGFSVATTPPSLNRFGINLLSNFAFGSFLAFLYFQFDLLLITSTLFYFSIIQSSFTLCATNNSFYTWNMVFIVIAIVIAPVIYIISRIKNEEFILENYGLPSHIQRISERERLKKELEIAAKVQLSLLPKEEPKLPGYDISAISIPAVEAGGDYFDFVKLSGNKMGIAIGDVSGKGVGAAIYMTLTKGILQAHAEEDVSPKNVLGKVNRLLYKTIEKNSFVSMFYAILDISQHTLLYSRAGHNPGILCSEGSGKTKLLLSKGMALGLEEGSIFTSTLNEEEISLSHGDIFVLYTDGFTEAMNEKQELYGEEKLIKLIEEKRSQSAKDIINIILKDVRKFVDNYPQHDDMTILVVKRI
jgi:hypothetical protein